MTRLYASAAAAAVIGLLGGTALYLWTASPDDPFAQCRAGQVAGGGAIGGPFTLVDETGATVTEAEVLAKPALVYFGYTFCPDVCPFDNERNARAVDILEERGLEVTPVFITVDPARDTPEVMAEYTDYMHPRLLGLTGTPEQSKAAQQAYKVYSAIPDTEDEYYLVDHTTMTYLMLPGTGFAEFFRRETTADEMAERTACFLNAG